MPPTLQELQLLLPEKENEQSVLHFFFVKKASASTDRSWLQILECHAK